MGTDRHCDRRSVCGVSIQAGTWGQTDTVTGCQCVAATVVATAVVAAVAVSAAPVTAATAIHSSSRSNSSSSDYQYINIFLASIHGL